MIEWEYLVIDPDCLDTLLNGINMARLSTVLNELGNKGWELVTITIANTYIFKRPKG